MMLFHLITILPYGKFAFMHPFFMPFLTYKKSREDNSLLLIESVSDYFQGNVARP